MRGRRVGANQRGVCVDARPERPGRRPAASSVLEGKRSRLTVANCDASRAFALCSRLTALAQLITRSLGDDPDRVALTHPPNAYLDPGFADVAPSATAVTGHHSFENLLRDNR